MRWICGGRLKAGPRVADGTPVTIAAYRTRLAFRRSTGAEKENTVATTAKNTDHGRLFRIKEQFHPVACVAIVEEDRLLMVREGASHKRGRWNLPGGRLEPDEGPVQAAGREAREETGYVVSLNGLIGVYSYATGRGRDAVRFLLSGVVESGEPEVDGDEILDVRWIELDEIEAMPDSRLWRPGVLRPMLRDIRRGVPFPIQLLENFDPTIRAAA